MLDAFNQRMIDLTEEQEKIVEFGSSFSQDLLETFKSINRQSKLPRDISGVWSCWANKPFFQVSMSPVNEERLKKTLRLILEDHYREMVPPASFESLLKNVVLRYLNEDPDFSVKAYKISDSPKNERFPISEYIRFSGGQKVSAAIILYITLARIIKADSTSRNILCLDNPFAKCNADNYVRLQFDIANFYGIQLIYATGHDILTSSDNFQRFITMRREASDKKGFQHVEVVQ
jgi:hypothetical protein